MHDLATSDPLEYDALHRLDTTQGSLLHCLIKRVTRTPAARHYIWIYLATIALTYAPMLIGAVLSPLPLWNRSSVVHLPFLRDLNIAFAFLVSFPTLVYLLLTDQKVLSRSLELVVDEGAMSIPADILATRIPWWNAKFHQVNIRWQICGLALGIVLSSLTVALYWVYRSGFWIGTLDQHLVVGYIYWVCIMMLYALITLFVARCVYMTKLLRDLVSQAKINMLPSHPDRCGGLRPIGTLGLRNQYTISILGMNIVTLAFVFDLDLPHNPAMISLLCGAVLAYLVLGPIVFLGPLLPFRAGMQRTKDEWGRELTMRMQFEFERIRGQIKSGEITRKDKKDIDRLRKIGTMIEELPVWPFDARTLRRFAGAYAIPILSTAAEQLPTIIKWIHAGL